MKIDITKKYQTRDGCPVRIYAVDGGSDHDQVHGATKDTGGTWYSRVWGPDGRALYNGGFACDIDLVEIRPEHKVWVNIYRDAENHEIYAGCTHQERRHADVAAYKPSRIACIPITFREGDGLED